MKKFLIRPHTIVNLISCGLILLLISSLFLQASGIRDRIPLIAAVYYGLPLPVIASCCGLVALLQRRRVPVLIISLITGVACLGLWYTRSYQNPLPPTSNQQNTHKLKVLFWNMAHHPLPSETLEKWLEDYQPDIVALVETGSRHSDPNPLVVKLPSGYSQTNLKSGIGWISRGQINIKNQLALPNKSKGVELEVYHDNTQYTVIIADIYAGPLTSRKPALEKLYEMATQTRKGPVMIAGDFNTPIESAFFDGWHHQLHHAFNTSGKGLRETWPRWLPVLTIDHVWSSKELPPNHVEKLWHADSDHAALLVTY